MKISKWVLHLSFSVWISNFRRGLCGYLSVPWGRFSRRWVRSEGRRLRWVLFFLCGVVRGSVWGVHGGIRGTWRCLGGGRGTVEEGGDVWEVVQMSAFDHQESAVWREAGCMGECVLLLYFVTVLANSKFYGSSILRLFIGINIIGQCRPLLPSFKNTMP